MSDKKTKAISKRPPRARKQSTQQKKPTSASSSYPTGPCIQIDMGILRLPWESYVRQLKECIQESRLSAGAPPLPTFVKVKQEKGIKTKKQRRQQEEQKQVIDLEEHIAIKMEIEDALNQE